MARPFEFSTCAAAQVTWGAQFDRIPKNAQIDCVDRDPFLTSICAGVNRRDQVPGKIVVADLRAHGWQDGLSRDYDAVVTANALHWFEVPRAEQLAQDIHALLRSGGVFVFAEPASPEVPFAAGFEEWKAKQPPRYSRENWERFWSTANRLLGYDHKAWVLAMPIVSTMACP